MTQEMQTDRGWRGSPELWLDAAYEALVEKGVDGVKIMPLANALQLSRTSFYWFFKDRRQLLAALLNRWEASTTGAIVAAARDYAATETEAMLNIISTFLSDAVFDTKLELAVRAWAQQDPAVLARLQRADAARLAALRKVLEDWGHGEGDADVRARTIYLVQVGYISMRVHEPLEERLERFPKYVEIYTGKRPPAQEMERFMARIGCRSRKD
ncbi:TetR/AcrR family transcriptional regulator [Pseudooceanicola sp. CBS1P-1]|uniref:TetR family transcriptional regulator n=1 Tax=Pseudooceanicola albus TaxID=2692189 RepID=A0A6L7GAB6_9RHOB|nr:MULTISPECIES: TetR/AcrR family transcriptional regulator [Pseudooceanicola]MBT9386765.1 TetR/AcrR family transcriptional regulator [Pseudooceanicola endophyticus]MXN20971.1 TetR family transcriptional regulator [Pseudooceanicola albus]